MSLVKFSWKFYWIKKYDKLHFSEKKTFKRKINDRLKHNRPIINWNKFSVSPPFLAFFAKEMAQPSLDYQRSEPSKCQTSPASGKTDTFKYSVPIISDLSARRKLHLQKTRVANLTRLIKAIVVIRTNWIVRINTVFVECKHN